MLAVKAGVTAANSSRIRPRSARSPCAYRPAIAATNSSRAAMLIRLILSPADENRSGANQMRQHTSFREHFRRGNARDATYMPTGHEAAGLGGTERRVRTHLPPAGSLRIRTGQA